MRASIRTVGRYVWHTMVCVTALTLVLSLFWSVSYLLSIHHRRQAERMVRQLAALPPGSIDFHQTQRIGKASGARENCTEELCSYDFDDRFMFADSWLPRVLKRTEWDYLGLRPWLVSVVAFKRPSGPTDIQVIISVGRGQGVLWNQGPFTGNMWAEWVVFVRTNRYEFDHAFDKQKEEVLAYGSRTRDQIEATVNGLVVTTPRPGEKRAGEFLNVYLSPDAPSSNVRAAFDLNLRCATDIAPCTELCQFAPSAWRSYVQFFESNGLTVGQSSDCAAIAHRQ